ncbi:MAG: hypothetical protein KDJ22_15910, partial [Candidatus Competibacteraceae bacterium]|nr:hypothetical protein [Candidatus Competibacteraceae bacterium]
VAASEWAERQPEPVDLSDDPHGLGRELFAVFRANATGAEQGAITFGTLENATATPIPDAAPVHDHVRFTQEEAP